MTNASPRILAVDDTPEHLDLIQVVLESGGFHVLVASDGHEGLRLACVEKPDLICLDMRMEPIDGAEVLIRLKADSSTRAIPVVMVSATNVAWERPDLELAGQVCKPFLAEELLQAVRNALKGNHHAQNPSG